MATACVTSAQGQAYTAIGHKGKSIEKRKAGKNMKLADRIFKRTDWHMTSKFGPRKHPVTGEVKPHNGTDYGTGGTKWPQYAIENGMVLRTGTDPGAGKFVWVNYPRIGLKLFQCHLDSINVRAGQAVMEGALLGTTGTTGNSTGIHMHLGMQPSTGGAWRDPHAYNYIPPLPKQNAAEHLESAVLDIIAREVIRGKWGNGDERRKRLAAAGHNPAAVQKRVNELLKQSA